MNDSDNSFKSSTVGPEALAARLEKEKKDKEEREKRKKANEVQVARRKDANEFALKVSREYDAETAGEKAAKPVIPVLSRGNNPVGAIKNELFSFNSNPSVTGPNSSDKAPTFNRLKRS